MRNPVKEVKIPSDRDAIREHVLSADEEGKYLAAALELHAGYVRTWSPEKQDARLPNMHDLAVLMLEQGARPEELLAARVEDIDLAAGTLTIRGGKTRAARRLLDLTERSREVIARRLSVPADAVAVSLADPAGAARHATPGDARPHLPRSGAVVRHLRFPPHLGHADDRGGQRRAHSRGDHGA
jgi:integrase